MKRILKTFLAVSAVLIAVNASAQFGFKAGYLSTAFKEKSGGDTYRSRPTDGFRVGVDYDIQFGWSGFSIRPGVNYSYFGDSEKFDGETFKQRYHFLNVPLDFKYDIDLGDCSLYAFVGPKFVLGLAGQRTVSIDGFKTTVDDFTGKYTLEEGGESAEGDQAATLNRFDVQIGAGLGFQFYGVSVELGYDWGMLNMLKYGRKDLSMKRDQISVTLGYAF